MYPVSNRFTDAPRGSHTVISRIDVLKAGETIQEGLPIVTGVITADENAKITRTLDVELADPDGALLPESSMALLAPASAELLVWRGFRYSDGAEELAPQGIFRIGGLSYAEQDGQLIAHVSGLDRAAKLQGKAALSVAIPAGTPVEAAIAIILTSRWPAIPILPSETGFTTPALLFPAGHDAWDEAAKLAESIGCDLQLSRLGQVAIAPKAIAAGSSYAWQFVEGVNANFFDPIREMASDDLANVVIVTGSHSATSGIRAEVGDVDPDSPTYRYGPFGEQVYTEDSERVSSIDQAYAMAKGILAKRLGPSEQLGLSTVPHPGLDLGDVVAVTRSRLGLDQKLAILESFQLPLTAADGSMPVTCRRSVITELPPKAAAA